MNRKGFTLIELLIVIVIIGILAAAVITAINPVEQIKKANDSGRMSTANELVNSINIYYTTNLAYPWAGSSSATIPDEPGGSATLVTTVLGATGSDNWMTTLTGSSDIKETLTGRDFTGVQIWIGADGGPVACFAPESDAYIAKAKYDANGQLTSTDPAYICVK